MGQMHTILREICPFKIRTPKGCRRIRRHSRNPVKLLLGQVTTSIETNLAVLILIIDTYKIKSNCTGEDISKAVDIFKSVF